ncbi:MAG TPA: chaperonin GroEL [Candidatus Pelethenecus sp.]|nr:chaperonin GroEL [Candidatus Pelethenecus sp.]
MQTNQVNRYENIRNKIEEGLNIIADPVRGTMSPLGRNVMFRDSNGRVYSSNDGATIAKNIRPKDPIHSAVVEVVKGGSLKTNIEVGDGTSTTILLSQILTKEGFRLIDAGWNPMQLKREFVKIGAELSENIKKQVKLVKNDKDLYQIAYISANNDEKIAKDVTRIIKVAGVDGMIFLENGSSVETEIIEDTGFIIPQGLLTQELKTDPQRFVANYVNVPVLITDKRLYYKAEAESIMSSAILAGYKGLVVIARDFLGEALSSFMANHLQGRISLLLIKDPKATDTDRESLHDIADYLGGRVIMDKAGDLVGNITPEDFVIANKVFADPSKTIVVTAQPKNKKLKNRISAIRQEIKKDKENTDLKKRLASLTNGMVTVKVGGNTQIETAENVYRYEDSIQATRTAMKDGYLVGGGLALWNAFQGIKINPELEPAFRKFCEGNIRQIAINCGKHPESILEQIKEKKGKVGYNAMTDKIEDLLKAGVIDPYKVTENAVNNSISITNQIISSDFLIVEDEEDNKE